MLEYLDRIWQVHQPCHRSLFCPDYKVHLNGDLLRLHQGIECREVVQVPGAVALWDLSPPAFVLLYIDGCQELWFNNEHCSECKGDVIGPLVFANYCT